MLLKGYPARKVKEFGTSIKILCDKIAMFFDLLEYFVSSEWWISDLFNRFRIQSSDFGAHLQPQRPRKFVALPHGSGADIPRQHYNLGRSCNSSVESKPPAAGPLCMITLFQTVKSIVDNVAICMQDSQIIEIILSVLILFRRFEKHDKQAPFLLSDFVFVFFVFFPRMNQH